MSEGSNELRRKLEAILLVSGRPVDLSEASKFLKASKAEIKKAADELKEIYEKYGSALEVLELDGKFMVRVRQDLSKLASKFSRRPFLSKSVAKTLSLIAFEGPLTIDALKSKRGRKVYSHLKTLERLGLIKLDYDQNLKTKVYSVTDNFVKVFGALTRAEGSENEISSKPPATGGKARASSPSFSS